MLENGGKCSGKCNFYIKYFDEIICYADRPYLAFSELEFLENLYRFAEVLIGLLYFTFSPYLIGLLYFTFSPCLIGLLYFTFSPCYHVFGAVMSIFKTVFSFWCNRWDMEFCCANSEENVNISRYLKWTKMFKCYQCWQIWNFGIYVKLALWIRFSFWFKQNRSMFHSWLDWFAKANKSLFKWWVFYITSIMLSRDMHRQNKTVDY